MSKFTINITRIFTILMFVVLTVAAVSISVFELDFYTKTQAKYNVAERMGLTEQELEEATMVSLVYTQGYTDDLTYHITRDGKQIDIYSKQDKEHMIDVANLYKGAYNTMVFASGMMALAAVILFIKRKEVNVFMLTDTINRTSFYTLIFVAIIGVFAFVNFNTFWTYFHKVFFSNDLWLMNPATDALVNLFPEQLFSALVFKILLRFIILFGIANLIAFGYRAYSMRGDNNND